ncbi:MAG: hypothetical protein E8D45_09440 [Nitrospira sp.]|nr:MAG: hypothetical protein E8D45_09440 [Nitrospira sp.]
MFHAPDTGMGANAKRGAGLGAAQSAYALQQPLGIIGILALPVLAPSFAMVGAVYGAAASEPAALWRDAESAFRTEIKEVAVADVVPNHLVSYAKEHGFEIHVISRETIQNHITDSQYRALAEEGINTVLELSELRVSLDPATFVVNPPRRLFTSARIRLIRTADSVILDDRTVLDELAGTRLLNAWTVGHAQAFREEVGQAAERLAKQIIEELFWRDPLVDRCEGLLMSICVVGPKPLYPPLAVIPEVPALRPVLQWEPSPARDVTYDLMIWRAEGLDTGGLVHMIWRADWLKPGVLVYSRERLAESSHRLEASLQPNTTYLWTVRARFSSEGRIRMAPWGTKRIQVPAWMHWLSLGLTKLDEPGGTYFPFRTPDNLR